MAKFGNRLQAKLLTGQGRSPASLFLSQSLSSAGFGVGFIGLILAAILIFAGLRPDPRDVGRELARLYPYPESVPRQGTRSLAGIVRQPGVIVAMVSVVFAQMVMMVPMSITPVQAIMTELRSTSALNALLRCQKVQDRLGEMLRRSSINTCI